VSELTACKHRLYYDATPTAECTNCLMKAGDMCTTGTELFRPKLSWLVSKHLPKLPSRNRETANSFSFTIVCNAARFLKVILVPR